MIHHSYALHYTKFLTDPKITFSALFFELHVSSYSANAMPVGKLARPYSGKQGLTQEI
jgi:hypothetical protein